jgi:glutamate N-acetyltransferase/amino-acid acetyltransferase
MLSVSLARRTVVVAHTQPAVLRVAAAGFLRSFSTLLPPPKRLPADTVTAEGFHATGVRCGIKKKCQKRRQMHALQESDEFSANDGSTSLSPETADVLDFALIRSVSPCSAAGVFTTNQFCAAPVLQSKKTLQAFSGVVGGVAINAGCANACTGERGLADAEKMTHFADELASIPHALVMSTGVIGPFLPMEKIQQGFLDAAKQLGKKGEPTVDGWEKASRAIMTTDTQPKALHRTLRAGGKTYTISGVCKGAGMIAPNMAPPHGTLLGVVATDISISPSALQTALTHATERSFNSISIDGDTSTNDTIAALANGQAAAWKQSTPGSYAISSPSSPGFSEFTSSLTAFCQDLSHQIVQDGEGATRFVEVSVAGARSYGEAKIVANSVARSMLVKTALFGGQRRGTITSGVRAHSDDDDLLMRAASCFVQVMPTGVAFSRRSVTPAFPSTPVE